MAMVLLVGFHLFYMHLIVGVDAINFEVISERWSSPFWRLYGVFMLTFAWLHCKNGVRIVLGDYILSQGWRVFAKSILYYSPLSLSYWARTSSLPSSPSG
jgi:succinate dehydrogenase hydrophobic anchor subunit